MRELGGAVGIALLGSFLNNQYHRNIASTVEGLSPELAEPVRSGIGGALASAEQLGPDAVRVVDEARSAFVDRMRPTLWIAVAVALAAAAYTAAALRMHATPPSGQPSRNPPSRSVPSEP